MKNIIVSAVIAFLVGVGAGYALTHQNQTVGFAPTGTTNSTAKLQSKVVSLALSTATTTSIQNSSGYDWAITDSFAVCNGVGTSKTAYTGTGLANLILTGATTSTAISGNLADSNTNYGTNMTVSTSTSVSYNSTSTEGVLTGFSRIVSNGNYYTFSSNATNTASCTIGFHYLSL